MKSTSCWNRSCVVALLMGTLAHAQAPLPAAQWLESEEAATFRRRVVELALIYEEGSGIDPQGYKVDARKAGVPAPGCVLVEVVTRLQQAVVRAEAVEVCKH